MKADKMCRHSILDTIEAKTHQIQLIPHLHRVLQVLLDACQARGRDIIIITTEMGMNGGPVTRRYLNVPPSPDTSPVSCMSPSDIVLKTGSPNSPEGENIFNFKGTSELMLIV